LPTTLLVQERVETPDPPVILVRLRVHDSFVELGDTDSVTVLKNPPTGATVIADVPEADTPTLNVEGLAVMLKS
jgi:hypothetical protein